ncbi:MAG: replication initiator protein A [Sterolibacterium sp.]
MDHYPRHDLGFPCLDQQDAEKPPYLAKLEAFVKARKLKEEAEAKHPISVPDRIGQEPDRFVLNLLDASLKCDQESMEAPLYSLATNDLKAFEWVSQDGRMRVSVTPPQPCEGESRKESETRLPGRATIHDKDILIFLASQILAQDQKGMGLPSTRVVQFTAYDFLMATNRGTSGNEYQRMISALERLSRTYVKIQVRNRDSNSWKKRASGFNLIAGWEVIERGDGDPRMVGIAVRLSEPFFDAIQERAVLTLHKDYFGLRQPLARRLYEIARKHVGKQNSWKIGLEALRGKAGSTSPLRNFRLQVRKIINEDTLPEYGLRFDDKGMVVFYSKASPFPISILKLK